MGSNSAILKTCTFIFAFAFILFAGSSVAQVRDIDGNMYRTVPIGVQDWMVENLQVGHFRNGDQIPEARTDAEWKRALANGEPAYCNYNNLSGDGNGNGKLYNWYAVVDLRGLAPVGWQIPADFDWTVLVGKYGGNMQAGSRLKSKWGWTENGNGSNEAGLAFLPGGQRNPNGSFAGIGTEGYWWSITASDATHAWSFGIDNFNSSINRSSSIKGTRFSVRCFRN